MEIAPAGQRSLKIVRESLFGTPSRPVKPLDLRQRGLVLFKQRQPARFRGTRDVPGPLKRVAVLVDLVARVECHEFAGFSRRKPGHDLVTCLRWRPRTVARAIGRKLETGLDPAHGPSLGPVRYGGAARPSVNWVTFSRINRPAGGPAIARRGQLNFAKRFR